MRTLLLALALLAPAAAASGPAAAPAPGRVIVLGFDGADARTAAALMDAGELPHLAKLRAEGTFAGLASTVPAESPVAWAALNSGQNPAKTGISGFIRRDLTEAGDPVPALGHVRHEARASSEFALPVLERALLAWNPWLLAAVALAGVTLVFWGVFGGLLRVRTRVALPLALALGAVGAAGARIAGSYVPHTISDVVANPTAAAPFWEVAAQAGVPCVVLDGAMAWDRPEVPGAKVLAGLGVPDVRANNGDWFVYTTDPQVIERAPAGHGTSTGGRVFRVDERDGVIESWVYGPFDYVAIDAARREHAGIEERMGRPGLSAADVEALRARKKELETEVLPRLECSGRFRDSQAGRVSLPLTVHREAGQARVAIGGHEQALQPGAWSGWYHLSFELSPLVKVRAITRCKLVRLEEPFELFVDFLQYDPAHTTWWQPVSQPPGFAAELAHATGGGFDTVGWACLTMPFKDREIDPQTFLEDIEFTYEARVKLLRAALAQDDWRALVFIESTPDRVQHMMYQFSDTAHPSYDAAKAAQRVRFLGEDVPLSDAIRAAYRSMDRVVGEVVEQHLKPGDTLIVCADHGFQSFRRQVHLNNWLAHEGFLALRPGVRSYDARHLSFVDWSRTRAYAVGLGGIYLNLQGRERNGIVAPTDAPAVLAELRERLLAATDGEGGPKVVRDVVLLHERHVGPHGGDEADLMPGFEAGWRVSWATTLGDISLVESEDGLGLLPGPVYEDNRLNWSGDHISVAGDLVQGVFFSNRKVELPAGGVDLLHVAPTALSALGVAVPADCDLPPLRFVE